MKFILFVSVALIVFALLTLYVKKRFVNKLHIKEQYKKYLTWFLLLNYFGIILYMYGRYNPIFPNAIYFMFSLPIGLLFIFFCVTLMYDILRIIIVKTPINEQRRKFFKQSLDIGAFAFTSPVIVKSVYDAMHIEIENVDIKIKDLNQEYKIVQLSDIHIGGLINKDTITKIVDRVNGLGADLVVITGDLVDIKLEYAKEALEELNKLQSKFGTYFIVGNHEYIHGVDRIITYLKTLKIKVLENESVFIGKKGSGFNLVGVYDIMGYRVGHHEPDISKALKNIDKKRPIILLAHQPRFINETLNVDLVLSGHTHGGQIFPFNYLVRLQQPYVSGLHQHNDKMQIYINKGTGFWGPPMRLASSCEITNIRIF